MAKMSGGEALAKSLVREGVEVVFGIPGIHMSGSVVAMRDEPSIRIITTRNESGSTHMADGYCPRIRKTGVALVVPGAGVYRRYRPGHRVCPFFAGAPHCRPNSACPDRHGHRRHS